MNNKIRAAILTVLDEHKAPVHRTKLVKLIYLAENLYFEHFGTTITGLQYMWDNHGPNAISNAVVKEADKLVDQDYLCMKIGTSMYGGETFIYSRGSQNTEPVKKALNPLEAQVICDTVQRYRHFNIRDLVATSKKTAPFQSAQQYQILNMQKSTQYQEALDMLKENPEIIKSALASLGEGVTRAVSLQEAKQKYGL